MKYNRNANPTHTSAHHAVFGFKSDPGAGGKPNEDAYTAFSVNCASIELYAAAVADGVTSTNGGGRAAQLAVNSIRQSLTTSFSELDRIPDHTEVKQLVKNAIAEAEHVIKVEAEHDEGQGDMSTTLVVALVLGDILYVAHAGDSRAYLCRRHKIYRLTIDHSYIEQLIREGELTREEAEHDPRRSGITRYLGPDLEGEIDHTIVMPGSDRSHEQLVDYIELQSDDIILLCSDGLTKKVSDAEIHNMIVHDAGSLQHRASGLVHLAVKQKSERDNVTVVLIKIPGAEVAGDQRTEVRSQRLPIRLLVLVAALLVIAMTSAWAIQRSTDIKASPFPRTVELAIAPTNTPTLSAMEAPTSSSTLLPKKTAPSIIQLPTATATLVLLEPSSDPEVPPSELPEPPTNEPSVPISFVDFVEVTPNNGFGVSVIINSSVLSAEIGSSRIDICLEILYANDERTATDECKNLWDAFSVADENLDDIGCSRSRSSPEIVCTVSEAELALRYGELERKASRTFVNFYSLKPECEGKGCRDTLVTRRELVYP